MPSTNREIISIHVQDATVKQHDTSFQEPFKDVSDTFKAGFFTGVVSSALLLAASFWIFI